MRQKEYIYKVRARVLLMTALLLAACTADDETTGQQDDTLQLAAYMHSYDDITRGVPDGYQPFMPEDVMSIGIFMTPFKDNIQTLGYFSFNGQTWRSNISLESDSYYIYGFMPGDVIDKSNCSVSMLDGKTSFADGAVLTLDGLKPISKTDVCVIVGVQGLNDPSTEEKNVELGRFYYAKRPKGQNYVNLLMDHIYSCVQFRMKVDADYAKVRTIKLKRMEMKTTAVSATKAVVTLTANTSGNNPISNISWATPTSGTGMSIVLFEDEEGKALSDTENLVLNSNLMPGCSDVLSLVCTYDVYDRKGNLVRKDCEVPNKLPSTLLLSSLKAGERQPINMTVTPTYIYVLSDPDVDNPTLTFN